VREIVLDTETTGLDPLAGHRVVEVGCIELVNTVATGRTFHAYFNPEMLMPMGAQDIHGLSDEFLADKPLFAAIADELLEYLCAAEVVIHNAAFDVGFLNEELRRLGRPAFHTCVGKITDSLPMAREMFPGKSNSLDALCRRLEVDNSNRTLHGALLDAGLLAEVYINMTRGQDSLVIDGEESGAAVIAVQAIDLSQFTLPVLLATDSEIASHELLLAELDKASGGKTVWRTCVA